KPSSGTGDSAEDCRNVNLRELQAIRQSLQLKAASPPWWTSAADGQGPTLSDNAGESPLNAVYASLRGCSRSWRGVEASMRRLRLSRFLSLHLFFPYWR